MNNRSIEGRRSIAHYHALRATHDSWSAGLSRLEEAGFRPSRMYVQSQPKDDIVTDPVADGEALVLWIEETAREADAWIRLNLKGDRKEVTSRRAVKLLFEVASLQGFLNDALYKEPDHSTETVGNVTISALGVGLALQKMLGNIAAENFRKALEHQSRGLRQGNEPRITAKLNWQRRVRLWTESDGFDWHQSNAALATAFRRTNPRAGAPDSAELDKFISGLRRQLSEEPASAARS